jgi:hypothetical protein
LIITDGLHLSSDASLGELHTFAQRIGLKRAWFQDHWKYPHYDLTTKRMASKAIRCGARRVTPREFLRTAIMKKVGMRGRVKGLEEETR